MILLRPAAYPAVSCELHSVCVVPYSLFGLNAPHPTWCEGAPLECKPLCNQEKWLPCERAERGGTTHCTGGESLRVKSLTRADSLCMHRRDFPLHSPTVAGGNVLSLVFTVHVAFKGVLICSKTDV